LAFDVLVRDDASGVAVREPTLDLIEEVQALHHVIEAGIGGEAGRRWTASRMRCLADDGADMPASAESIEESTL
jgi:hypothetical protein